MFDGKKNVLGILVGGGPAPGINGVISAATIEAIQSDMKVLGFFDGFEWLMKDEKALKGEEYFKELRVEDVTHIHFEGGSYLRTSRANPSKSEETLKKVLDTLINLGVTHLLTIGGDDTAFSASELHHYAKGLIKVAHVPKTIDNDLNLPGNMPTFGYNTARHYGTEIVLNLMEDAKTTNRWYFVAVMGRSAGHLAVGISKSAGATLAVIGEEFPHKPVHLDSVCRILEGAICKRAALGTNHGVAVIAEGVAEVLDKEELANIPGVGIEHDDHGNLRLAEVPLATILKRKVRSDLLERNIKMTVVDVTLGYELRCAPPIPYDCEYVRDLGYSAVRYLLEDAGYHDEGGAMICNFGGDRYLIPFHQLREGKGKRIKVRKVDLKSMSYQVAYKYMFRLKKEDFQKDKLEHLAKTAKMNVEEFVERFGVLLDPISGKPLYENSFV